MSIFDELAELWLKVQPSWEEPHQWIYAVDDAWFHPKGWKVLISDKEEDAVRECPPVFDDGLHRKIEVVDRSVFDVADDSGGNWDEVGILSLELETAPDDGGSVFELLRKAVEGGGTGDIDRVVVKRLIQFILDQNTLGLRYGVCFCSFEYFWKNAPEIDQPQNAVFFDIRHAFGRDRSAAKRQGNEVELGTLRDEWTGALEATALFSQTPNHMDRLGWYLHYCLKFAKVPGQSGSRSAIHDNHIQIVSSAVNPGSGRSDAMSDYSQVQEYIWATISPLGAKDVANLTPDRFTFSPMPKGGAMDTGLAIFNNSFKNAANWDQIKMWLIDDIAMLYAKKPDGHLESGHRNDPEWKWKWKGWFPSQIKSVSDPLYYRQFSPPLIGINDLLRLLSHSGVREFPRSWNGYDNVKVCLPTHPGIVFVILLIEFIRNLEPKDNRSAPSIRYRLNNVDTAQSFEIIITLDGGTSELETCYETGIKSNGNKCGWASKALRALGKEFSIEALGYIVSGNLSLQDVIKGGAISLFDQCPVEVDFPDGETIVIKLKAQSV